MGAVGNGRALGPADVTAAAKTLTRGSAASTLWARRGVLPGRRQRFAHWLGTDLRENALQHLNPRGQREGVCVNRVREQYRVSAVVSSSVRSRVVMTCR
jgi:hypothetical protein